MGYCSDGWWLNQNFCCWEIDADAEETDPFRGGGSRSASPAPTQSSGSVFTHGVRISSWHSGDSDSELELSLSRGRYGGPG